MHLVYSAKLRSLNTNAKIADINGNKLDKYESEILWMDLRRMDFSDRAKSNIKIEFHRFF